MRYKHLFFDMDKTVTPPRSSIDAAFETLLDDLPHDIVVVSGSHNEQMRIQIPNARIYQLGQNGNQAFDPDGRELWSFSLEDRHRDEIFNHIQKLIDVIDHELNEAWVPIEDRGGQITFSPIGNQAPVDLKKVYDPTAEKRLELMRKVPFESDELVVKIGGSTSLDYIHKDRHKGTNVAKLINYMSWSKTDCVYFGDGLYPGGNDEAVIGVIETVQVKDHHDTHRKIKALFN